MTNFGFIIDNRKCIGCHACTVACKSEHDVPVGVNRTWVKYIEKGEFPASRRLFSVMRCNHCDNAPCVEICPVTALYRRSDGIVDFDNQRCIGCKACMQACPYDALYIDPETHTAAKCNYCAHRVDIGLEPACVNVCPTHAIISGDLDNPESEIAQLKARQQVTARKEEKGTEPALFYIDGDAQSLIPSATEPTDQSMWSSQVAGVGHFAKYLDEKAEHQHTKTRDSQSMVETLASTVDKMGGVLSLGEEKTGVLVPFDPSGKNQKSGEAVARENARRAYDAPRKGLLWGWQVSSYMWTKAISAGGFLVPMLIHASGLADVPAGVQWAAALIGLLFLGLTGGLLTADLDQPSRFLNVLLRPQWRSWLVRGAYIITSFGAVLGLWCIAQIAGWASLAAFCRWAGCALAVMTAVYTAFLFAQAKGRDFWQSPMLSFHMFAHAVMAGGAIFALAAPFYAADSIWFAWVKGALAAGIVLHLLCDLVELTTTHPTEDAKRTVHSIVRGRYAKLYWFGVVLAGNVIPLLLIWAAAPLVMLAAVLVLIGVYLAEHVWVRAPQWIPLS